MPSQGFPRQRRNLASFKSMIREAMVTEAPCLHMDSGQLKWSLRVSIKNSIPISLFLRERRLFILINLICVSGFSLFKSTSLFRRNGLKKWFVWKSNHSSGVIISISLGVTSREIASPSLWATRKLAEVDLSASCIKEIESERFFES